MNSVKMVITSDLPKATKAFSDHLFFDPVHLATQHTGPVYSFFLIRNQSGANLAVFHCADGGQGAWLSPPKAPFGGILLQEDCTNGELYFFLSAIKEWIRLQAGKILIIKSPPSCYSPHAHRQLHTEYINTGFAAIRTPLNYYLSVTSAEFTANLHSSEIRRLNKCQRAGFAAALNRTISSDEIYDFLLQCRSSKGYPLPLSSPELGLLLKLFPDNFLVFTACDRGRVAAMIIAVCVNKNVLYSFLPCYLPTYAAFSPVVMLTQALYRYCQQKGFSVLDLGTSLDHEGKHKPSLSRFKLKLGARRSVKITYALKI